MKGFALIFGGKGAYERCCGSGINVKFHAMVAGIKVAEAMTSRPVVSA